MGINKLSNALGKTDKLVNDRSIYTSSEMRDFIFFSMWKST